MSNKATPYSFNYSVKYQLGNGMVQPASRKPKMLSIASIPDDNTVKMDHLDQRGIVFRKTGNFELPAFDEIEREELVLGGQRAGEPQFSKADFAFNRICDPDTNSGGLKLAQQIVESNGIPTINKPERVLDIRRDCLYQRFADFEGIVVPKTIRVTPSYCRDVRAILERGEVGMPCIFRPAGGHNSKGVFLIKGLDDTNELERFAFDGRDYYISELQDCRDEDGLYRKFRVIYVDGKLYPRHLFVSDGWCVDAKNKLGEKKYFDEEERFLQSPDSYFGEDVMNKLKDFCTAIGLDMFGLDFNRRPDGTLVVFEANLCMTVFAYSHRDYMEPFVENIRNATREMLMRFYQSVK